MTKQSSGAILIVLAFVSALFNFLPAALLLLIATGMLDIYLIKNKEQTISAYIRGLTPKYVDYCILVSLIALVIIFQGWLVVVWFVLGLLNSHFFEREQ